MSKIVKSSKLNRLWKNGIIPIKTALESLISKEQKRIDELETTIENPISTYDDMMANTVGGYILDPLAAKEGFNKINNYVRCDDTRGHVCIQALYDGYGATRLQSCKMDDLVPSINLYRRYAADDKWTRELAIYYKNGTFYGIGKQPDDEEAVIQALGGKINGTNGVIKKEVTSVMSVANKTYTNICSITIPAGKWLVLGKIRFSANATGGRSVSIHPTSKWSGIDNSMKSIGTMPDSLNNAKYFSVSEDTTLYLIGYQDSGTALSVETALLTAVRLD